MPKSKIIKELANGTVDTLIALKRTKVLLTGFDNVELNTWINNEITGYPKDAKIPTYRIVRGSLMGSYFKGSMASHMTWNHVSIPLGKMPEDLQDSLLNVSFREGVEKSRKKYLFLFDKGVYKFHEKRYNNTDKKQRWTKR